MIPPLPQGFLGTRANLLTDIVLSSLVLFMPALFVSVKNLKLKNYKLHKSIQITMAVILTIVVSIFEWDMKRSGGIFNMTQGSAWHDTLFLKASFFVHLSFSGITSVTWIGLILVSLFKFPRPPEPNDFSRYHKFFGRMGVIGMIMTALTGIEIYILAFVL